MTNGNLISALRNMVDDIENLGAAPMTVDASVLRQAIVALTPSEGFVLVPAEPTEAQWGGLARDVVMWMECYQTRSADSLLKHLNRCGTDIPKWLMEEVKGGSHSLAKGTVAAIIYKAMLEDRPEVK